MHYSILHLIKYYWLTPLVNFLGFVQVHKLKKFLEE